MMSLDPPTLDTIARCLDHLTDMSGLSPLECLTALEEYSQPLSPSQRTQILVWYDYWHRPSPRVH